MVITGSTIVLVNGRPSRVLGTRFNKAIKKVTSAVITDPKGETIVPSKGLTWVDVASQVRQGKKVQARCGASR